MRQLPSVVVALVMLVALRAAEAVPVEESPWSDVELSPILHEHDLRHLEVELRHRKLVETRPPTSSSPSPTSSSSFSLPRGHLPEGPSALSAGSTSKTPPAMRPSTRVQRQPSRLPAPEHSHTPEVLCGRRLCVACLMTRPPPDPPQRPTSRTQMTASRVDSYRFRIDRMHEDLIQRRVREVDAEEHRLAAGQAWQRALRPIKRIKLGSEESLEALASARRARLATLEKQSETQKRWRRERVVKLVDLRGDRPPALKELSWGRNRRMRGRRRRERKQEGAWWRGSE